MSFVSMSDELLLSTLFSPSYSSHRYSHYNLCFRSTLCSVMAQLTEETQPSFETTLKSKAVSESCNVKFTCVVTGYPVPELTWYKDDMEMDRYCGLPKYEIFRNGKTHTLHIYNCTLEDAAIYQASARNSKGIVTCSGVLEVGTMNEYQIHQRFFAKLKQKAQNKKKELEESRQQSKDNVQSPISLEPSQRKLLSPGETSGLVVDRDGLLKAQDKETVAEAGITEGALESTEPPEGTTELPNGFPVINENAKPPLTYIFETVEVVTTRQTNKGSQCKKKIKISNGEVSEKGGMSEDSGNVKEVSEGDVKPNDSNLEASNKEGTVRGPEARIIEQIESKLEPPNRECHARVCPPGIIELNGSNLEEHNKEAIIRVPVAGIKEPSDSNLEAFNKEGTVRDPETGIAEQIESKLEAPNKECIAKVCIPGITELNESNLEQHSKGDIVRDPVTEIKEPNDSNLEPPNKECNTRVYEPGIIELSESQLEQTNKEAIVTSSEAVIKESNESNLGLLNKEGIVKVFDAGIAEPIDSKLEPPNKECSVRVPETGTTHSIESKHKLPTNECNVRFPDSEITEPTESKEEPPNKECHVRVLDLGFSEPNESKLEISDNKGIVTVPEAGITKQLKSNLELPTKKCITPEVIEHERHVLKPHDFERKYKDDLEAPEYLVHNTYISKQSHLEESQMCPTALLGSVLSTKHAELPMAPSVGPVLSNVRDEVYLLGSESKSDLNRQNQDNTSTLEKTSSFVTETGNDFFSVQSIHIEESYKVNETESAADNKKDATTVIPTLKALTNVPGFVAPPISVTFVDSNCEKASHCKDEINEVQSLVSLLREVKNDLDTERLGVSSSLEGKKENSSFAQYTDQGPDARHPGVTDCSTVAPLGFSTSKQTSSPPMPVSAPNEFPKKTSPLVGCTEPEWSEQGCKTDCVTFIGHVQKDKSAAETVSTTIPQTPLLSPATMRRFAAKGISYLHSPGLVAVPTIQIETAMFGEKTGERQSGKDGMLPCESSPKLKRADSFTIIPSATPEELASGARRKIFISKTKGEEAESTNLGAQTRSTSLGAPTSQQTPPLERCSPILARKKATLQVPKEYEKSEETETTSTDEKLAEKKTDPFKAPQVIRKIRGEPFSDATGHLKLWCQFFNVLSDSTIKWYRDDLSIAEMERRSGDESQVALAIVQASSRDCGVYSCTIKNEYGMDSTDFLLSADSMFYSSGEEIEMTPMVFSKGLADSGCWGEKLFGRIVIAEVHVGEGCAHKACKVKVIYGLEPVFESGSTCVIKVRNPIAYGTREENNLLERNLEITKEECKRQNLIRQYCNIFAAEARVIENFGLPLEIIPLYLMYRPANTVPYATMEADLRGIFLRYCLIDSTGRLIMRNVSEVEQKCYTFQHWIHQFTNGNLLVTQLEGVGTKITNVRIATKSKGYQGLSDSGNPQVFQQFATQHHCNQYCGLLGLHSLKTLDSLQQPIKPKGSRSPLATRKMDSGSGSSSPQLQKKGALSPQAPKKVLSSPKMAKKSEASDSKSTSKHKTVEVPKVVRMR
uniref:non-specific serine/threonine protein kinase n=1 Tax=Scleropages formosus TaxID=113540 RepID=A0A8C9SHY6_SCLFO